MEVLNHRAAMILFAMLLFCPALPSTGSATDPSDKPPARAIDIRIQDRYVPSSHHEVGVVQALVGKGQLVIARPSVPEAFVGRQDDPVHEKDVLLTFGDVSCRVLFKDMNLLVLGPDTQLGIEEVSRSLLRKEKKARFRQTIGKVLFKAVPLFSCPNVKVYLDTPLSTVSVKGTELGSEVKAGSNNTSFLETATAEYFEDEYGVFSNPAFSSQQNSSFWSDLADLGERHRTAEMNKRTDHRVFFYPLGGSEEILRAGFGQAVYVTSGRVEVTAKKDGKTKELHKNETLQVGIDGLGEVSFDPNAVQGLMEGFDLNAGNEDNDPSGPTGPAGASDHLENPGTMGETEDIQQGAAEHRPEGHQPGHGHPQPSPPPCGPSSSSP